MAYILIQKDFYSICQNRTIAQLLFRKNFNLEFIFQKIQNFRCQNQIQNVSMQEFKL